MKRVLVLLAVLAVALLSGCQLWYMVVDPLYADIMGTWKVNVDSRPSGWLDTSYVFTTDKKLEIYYDSTLAYKGDVTSVDETTITTKDTYEYTGRTLTTMKMCYVLGSDKTTMRLGWYDAGNNPVYYLDLTAQ
jgi:hypothetical protein